MRDSRPSPRQPGQEAGILNRSTPVRWLVQAGPPFPQAQARTALPIFRDYARIFTADPASQL